MVIHTCFEYDKALDVVCQEANSGDRSADGAAEEGCGPLYLSNGEQSAEKWRRKVGKFYVRAYRGTACGVAKRYRFRWFTLTESDEAIEVGIDFGKEFHRFITWLRYRCKDFQYLVVVHRQGDKWRRNFHVLSYGSDKLPVDAMREYWKRRYMSTVSGLQEIRNIESAVKYLVKYVSDDEKYVRSWTSQGWVFRGWLSWSRWWRKNWSRDGSYPSQEALAALSLMSPDEREEITLQSMMKEEPKRMPVKRMSKEAYLKMVARRKEAEY